MADPLPADRVAHGALEGCVGPMQGPRGHVVGGGDGGMADMLSGVDFTPGRGIDFGAVGEVLLL
ncbi:hypothetical protein, partial [Streptomyces roseolus]